LRLAATGCGHDIKQGGELAVFAHRFSSTRGLNFTGISTFLFVGEGGR
jgi:hypothetical protein